PSEGSEFWVDNWSILASAPDPIAAHAFLNFMMDPQVCAKEIGYTYYAQCEAAAKSFIDPSLVNDPLLYPDAAAVARLESQKALSGDGQKLRQDIWNEFKAA